jgi:Leucine-rich repeat (LRR) protein
MQKSNKTKKKKNDSKNNSSHSSSNNSNISDENKNSLNNSGNNNKEKSINNNLNIESSSQNKKNIPDNSQEKLNQLKNLKYIFPFLSEGQIDIKGENDKIKNYSKSEYSNIVTSINKNKSSINKNKDEDEDEILEGKINIIDKVIQKHLPVSNDSKVITINPGLTSLSLMIDKNFNMMNDIGYRLPNLIELNLQGSNIESIMDIGTSFNKLEKLNVSGCGLTDLSGIICFRNLKELNASNNKITDLLDIEMCEELKFIDLSNNLISDENNLLFLNSCPNLRKVILTGNKLKTFNKDLLDKNIQLII